ncbi:GINS complex subunit [Malassezia sp. CBS 17886]|nr:GINS complex subunit [Malassezia sp. CBS 17886]
MSHARYALSDDDDDDGVRPGLSSYTEAKTERVKSGTPPPVPERDASRYTSDISGDTSLAPEDAPPITRLAHMWLNERGAPEIQSWDTRVFESVMAQITEQQSILDSLSSDPSTSEEEHFRLNLVQLDIERSKWLVRSYLRARLAKIEKLAAYIVQSSREQQRLSATELGYVRRYEQMGADHYKTSVLQYLPEAMQSLSDPPVGTTPGAPGAMMAMPNLDAPLDKSAMSRYVICRVALPLS